MNGTCANVGNWYYSVATTNTRTKCTNNEDTTSRNYTYTSDGNGSNNCNATYTDLCWVDLYETSNGVCAAVWTWYYSATNTNERSLCTTAISNSNYISDGGWTNSCSWECNTNYTLSGWVCTADGRNCTITNWTWNQVWWWSSWWTCTVVTCNTDYYSTNNTSCIAVWTWYYSNSTSTNRTICSNNPDTVSRNYTYTSDGNWTNSCSATYTDLCGVDLYETSNGTCSNVGTGKYSPSWNNTIYSCSNKASSNSYYTGDGNGGNSCGWSCDGGYSKDGNSCTYNTWIVWNYWSCSATCGWWTQTRAVTCSWTTCLDSQPITSQSCNTHSCNTAPHSLTISWANSWDIASWSTAIITLTASATDDQNDSLTYTWSATNATLSSTTWTSVNMTVSYNWWPVTITVTASDWSLSSWSKSVNYSWTDTSYDEEYEEWVESGYNTSTNHFDELVWSYADYGSRWWKYYKHPSYSPSNTWWGYPYLYYTYKTITTWVDTSAYETRTRTISGLRLKRVE